MKKIKKGMYQSLFACGIDFAEPNYENWKEIKFYPMNLTIQVEGNENHVWNDIGTFKTAQLYDIEFTFVTFTKKYPDFVLALVKKHYTTLPHYLKKFDF